MKSLVLFEGGLKESPFFWELLLEKRKIETISVKEGYFIEGHPCFYSRIKLGKYFDGMKAVSIRLLPEAKGALKILCEHFYGYHFHHISPFEQKNYAEIEAQGWIDVLKDEKRMQLWNPYKDCDRFFSGILDDFDRKQTASILKENLPDWTIVIL